MLGQFLARWVDLRGVRQREDVVAIARAALNQEGGASALLSTVELFEGPEAAAEVGHSLRPEGDPAGPAGGAELRPRPGARPGGDSGTPG